MTFEEAFEVIYILQSNYPNFYSRQTENQAEIMTQFWATAFRDYDLNIVMNALLSAIMKKKSFPPNIAEINEEIIKMVKPNIEQMDGEIAWGKVQSLIKNFGQYLFQDQQDALDKELDGDEILKMAIRACGGLEVLRMCQMNSLNTLRAQFIRIYNSYAKRKVDDLLLPNSLKIEINQIQQQSIEKSNQVINMLADKLSFGGSA